MKQFFKLSTLFLAAIAVLPSCGDESTSLETQAQETITRSSEAPEYLNITYKGVTYFNVPTTYNESGDFIFHDAAFAPIYEAELANDLDWSISAEDATNITFYGSLESNLDSNGIDIEDIQSGNAMAVMNPATRGGYEDLAELVLYDDKNFKDRNYTFVLNEKDITVDIPNLKDKPWKFNDKCSSLIITNNLPNDHDRPFPLDYLDYPCSDIEAVFIGYDDKKYSDRTIVCVCPAASRHEYPSLPGFNDKLSSFHFFFAQRGQYYTKF